MDWVHVPLNARGKKAVMDTKIKWDKSAMAVYPLFVPQNPLLLIYELDFTIPCQLEVVRILTMASMTI